MSDDDLVDARVAAALDAAASTVEPAEDWDAVARRVAAGEGGARRVRAVWPILATVAAAFLLVVLVVNVRNDAAERSEPYQVETLTGPTPAPVPGTSGAVPSPDTSIPIVALTSDNRLVELNRDGREVRLIHAGPMRRDNFPMEGVMRGPISVSPIDRTIYVEQSAEDPTCSQAYVPSWDVVGDIVAIPWDGGEPRVVVEAARAPAISPDGTQLAVVWPAVSAVAAIGANAPGIHCSNPHNQFLYGVVPLTAPREPGEGAWGAGLAGNVRPGGGADLVSPVRVAWADLDTLVVEARQPDAENLAGRCPTCGPVGFRVRDVADRGRDRQIEGPVRDEGEPDGGPVLPDDEREAFAVASRPAGADGRYEVVAGGVRAGGTIRLAVTTVDGSTGKAVGGRTLDVLGPTSIGDGAYAAVDTAVTADGAQILVLTGFDTGVPDGGRGRSIILLDGSIRLLGRGYLAAAFAELRS